MCENCSNSMKLCLFKRTKDILPWRCINKKCIKYKCYISVRENSFFENFDADIRFIFQVLLKYNTRTHIFCIFTHFGPKKSTIIRIIAKINTLIPEPDFIMNKLGVQSA
ncbi:hypothetical protein DMUE_4994 [Dictyocoela muelleri]|nr:hypothetical protein DMUE_4994 [Dictyocoela muelleri]